MQNYKNLSLNNNALKHFKIYFKTFFKIYCFKNNFSSHQISLVAQMATKKKKKKSACNVGDPRFGKIPWRRE